MTSLDDKTVRLPPLVVVRAPDLPVFSIQRRLVTVGEVRKFVAATGRAAPPLWNAGDDDEATAIGLSFFEAVAYARHIAMRLPTEEEWLAAAKAAAGEEARGAL